MTSIWAKLRWMIPIVVFTSLVAILTLSLVDRTSNGQSAIRPKDIELRLVADGLNSPIHLESPPDGSGRRFVVDRIGTIHVLMPDGQMLAEPFLDLRDRMVSLRTSYDERGLLGFTFHPDFAENGRVYVHYSAPLRPEGPLDWDHTGIVSEFQVSTEDPNRIDPLSERVILQVDQPQFNHNGGTIAFGPDGYLYIGLGDGGSGNDAGLGHPPMGNGQDVTTLLGSILRIGADGSIPPDNPFVGRDGRDEIFAWGFRNPFRFSFDRGGERLLFVADVGQNLWEEVNIVTGPGNFGWRIKEGSHWFNPDNSRQVVTTGASVGPQGEILVDPIVEYRHPNVRQSETVSEQVSAQASDGRVAGISVIGGYVYRGSALTGWQGTYIFGDWSMNFQRGHGKILAARPLAGDANGDLNRPWAMEVVMNLNEFVIGFGEDSDGELYILTTDRSGPSGSTGKVYQLVPASKN